jgi:hypothetical protein
MCVSGHLDLSGQNQHLDLPPELTAPSLDLSDCPLLTRLPAGLNVQHLRVQNCQALTSLPANLRCEVLEASNSGLRELPTDLQVKYKLDLRECIRLTTLPQQLVVQSLLLSQCVALTVLPEALDVCLLDLAGCTGLADWPEGKQLRVARLDLSGCVALAQLPRGFMDLVELNISGCTRLRQLPEGLLVRGWLDLTGSALTALPDSLRGVRLRWRNVFIEERVIFRPETITAAEVLAEPNAERRRIFLERMGYERFFREAEVAVLDKDRDAGGERRLLRVPMRGDEDLVCVSVRCPSTGRSYLLRVPPTTTSCQQAAAWIAGFDDPSAYDPVLET